MRFRLFGLEWVPNTYPQMMERVDELIRRGASEGEAYATLRAEADRDPRAFDAARRVWERSPGGHTAGSQLVLMMMQHVQRGGGPDDVRWPAGLKQLWDWELHLDTVPRADAFAELCQRAPALKAVEQELRAALEAASSAAGDMDSVPFRRFQLKLLGQLNKRVHQVVGPDSQAADGFARSPVSSRIALQYLIEHYGLQPRPLRPR